MMGFFRALKNKNINEDVLWQQQELLYQGWTLKNKNINEDVFWNSSSNYSSRVGHFFIPKSRNSFKTNCRNVGFFTNEFCWNIFDLIKQRFSTCTRKCSKFVSFKFLENFTKTCFLQYKNLCITFLIYFPQNNTRFVYRTCQFLEKKKRKKNGFF